MARGDDDAPEGVPEGMPREKMKRWETSALDRGAPEMKTR